MKKLVLTILVLFGGSVSVAHAETSQDIAGKLGLDKVDITKYFPIFKFSGIVETIISLLFAVIFLYFVARIILSGLKMMGAGADANKKQETFKAIINAVIGLVVSILALVITNFILSFFGVTSPTSILPDCKALSNKNDATGGFTGSAKYNCQVNAIKLISPDHVQRDCDYIGAYWDGAQSCVPYDK